MSVKLFWEIIKSTIKAFGDDKAARLAAALAYYTIFSLAPALILAVSVASLVISANRAQEIIIQQVQRYVGYSAAQSISQLLANINPAQEGALAITISAVTLIIAATGVFAQLQDALNTIWGVEPKRTRGIVNIIKDRFLAFAMLIGIGLILFLSLLISTAISVMGNFFSFLLPGGSWFWQTVNLIISVGLLMLVFAMIFKVLPNVKIDWKEVWVGALVTSILFNFGKFLLGFYLANSSVTSAYGAAGSVIVILIWVYYSSQIMFLGAEFTQVYARRFADRIEPVADVKKIDEGRAK